MSKKIVELRIEDLTEHPSAGIVPEMRGDEWEAFAEDVRVRGVVEPIVVCKNVVLDGRHRLRRQKELHVETIPARQVEMSESEQLDYLVKAALFRRHLTTEQRALLAARLKPHYEAAAESRMKSGKANPGANLPEGRARDQAGKAVGVSGKTVEAAEKVLEKASPEIVEMVQRSELSVSAAATVADLPKREQKKIAKEGPKAVKEAAKEQREKKKIPGGTEFPTDILEAALAADEAAKPQNPQEQMEATNERFDAILNHLKQAKAIATKLASEEVTGAWLMERWSSAKVEFDNLWTTFSSLKPGALCPRCHGKRCDYCRQTGHMTASFARQRKGA